MLQLRLVHTTLVAKAHIARKLTLISFEISTKENSLHSVILKPMQRIVAIATVRVY